MKKILLSLVFMLILSGVSLADIAYTTTSGGLGLIVLGSEASPDLKGIQYNSNIEYPAVAAYSDYDGKRFVMLVDNNTNDTSVSGDACVRFSSTNLASPIDSETKYLGGLYNSTAFVSSINGNSLFFASGSKIFDFKTSTLRLQRSFDCSSGDVDANIVNIDSNEVVYALVDSDGVSGDVLMRFDGQLKGDVYMFREWDVNNSSTEVTELRLLTMKE